MTICDVVLLILILFSALSRLLTSRLHSSYRFCTRRAQRIIVGKGEEGGKKQQVAYGGRSRSIFPFPRASVDIVFPPRCKLTISKGRRTDTAIRATAIHGTGHKGELKPGGFESNMKNPFDSDRPTVREKKTASGGEGRHRPHIRAHAYTRATSVRWIFNIPRFASSANRLITRLIEYVRSSRASERTNERAKRFLSRVRLFFVYK